MIHFVGAGPGAVDLITVRGQRYLKEADVIIYAGSLVNKGLLEYAKEGCEVYNSAYMTLEEVIEVMIKSEKEDKMTVRLHTGDPSLYGAIREQILPWSQLILWSGCSTESGIYSSGGVTECYYYTNGRKDSGS